jgi:predicted membrane protein (TIGR00267 family)
MIFMFEKFRTYAKITNLWPIARRYFVNNFYDGMLTVLGILLGFFIIIFQTKTQTVDSKLVIFTSLATSISMFFSGLTGSYLSEKAEQSKLKDELNKAIIIDELKEENLTTKSTTQDIEKAMLMKLNKKRAQYENESGDDPKNKSKTILERAEFVASIVVAFVNGFSPFLGGFISLLPFFFYPLAGFLTFMVSFIIILISIILLGIFLGIISKESIIKNILQMLIAFGLTIGISILILGA